MRQDFKRIHSADHKGNAIDLHLVWTLWQTSLQLNDMPIHEPIIV